MEEASSNINEPQSIATPDVSFPRSSDRGEKSSKKKWIVMIIGLVIIIGGGSFALYKYSNSSESDSSSSETKGTSTSSPSPTVRATPTPEPAKEKADVVIEILNGTGTAGDASFVESELEDIGYENMNLENAETQDETSTTITFDRKLDDENVKAITDAMEDVFKDVKVKKASLSGGMDVRIITGLKKGATAATATPSASPTPPAEEATDSASE